MFTALLWLSLANPGHEPLARDRDDFARLGPAQAERLHGKVVVFKVTLPDDDYLAEIEGDDAVTRTIYFRQGEEPASGRVCGRLRVFHHPPAPEFEGFTEY